MHTCSAFFLSVIHGVLEVTGSSGRTAPPELVTPGRVLLGVGALAGGRPGFGRAGASGSLSGLCPA